MSTARGPTDRAESEPRQTTGGRVYRLVNRHPPNTNNRITMIRSTSMTLLTRSRGGLISSLRSGREVG